MSKPQVLAHLGLLFTRASQYKEKLVVNRMNFFILYGHGIQMQVTTCCVEKRGKDLPYDPSRADSGVLATPLSYHDKYFEIEPQEDSALLVLDQLLDGLPDRQRAAIEMCVISQISYAQAGRIIGCSDQTMRRETMRALSALRERMSQTPWLATMLDRSYLTANNQAGVELPEVL